MANESDVYPNEWEDTQLVKDLMRDIYCDTYLTEYEFACAMKCSVRQLRMIRQTGHITKRKWDLLGEILQDVYSGEPEHDGIS